MQVNAVADKETKPVFLLPNQKFVGRINSKRSLVSVTKDNSAAKDYSVVVRLDSTKKQKDLIETAWIYNRLEFRGEKFAVLSKKMERWFDVNFHFANEKLKELVFDGSFESETIDQALTDLMIASSSPFTFKINGTEVYIND